MSAKELLKQAKIVVSPETFYLVSLSHKDWYKLLENPELSPRMTAPFMIFRDQFEVTLLFDEMDFAKIRHVSPLAKTEGNFRLLSYDIELGFDVIGFMAEITRVLAESEISIIALSAFSRDHILVKQTNLSNALKALSRVVDEIC